MYTNRISFLKNPLYEKNPCIITMPLKLRRVEQLFTLPVVEGSNSLRGTLRHRSPQDRSAEIGFILHPSGTGLKI